MQNPKKTVTDADLVAILANDPFVLALEQSQKNQEFHDDWRDETPIHIHEPDFSQWGDELTEDERWEIEETTMPYLKNEKYWCL